MCLYQNHSNQYYQIIHSVHHILLLLSFARRNHLMFFLILLNYTDLNMMEYLLIILIGKRFQINFYLYVHISILYYF
jgi:hypothetical protein